MDYRFSRLGTYESTQFLVPNPACRSQGTVRELFCQGAEFGGFRQDLGMNIQKPQHFLWNPWGRIGSHAQTKKHLKDLKDTCQSDNYILSKIQKFCLIHLKTGIVDIFEGTTGAFVLIFDLSSLPCCTYLLED